jgi:hypothetical protein
MLGNPLMYCAAGRLARRVVCSYAIHRGGVPTSACQKMFTPDSTALCSHLLGGRLTPHRANQGRAVGDHRSADGFQARQAATKTWRRLKGENQLPKVITGVKFVNGVEWIEPKSQNAA